MNLSTFNSQKVLVTGGMGFLGRHVVEQLRQRTTADVFVARRSEYDLTREENVERLFQDSKPGIVIHLAGLVGGILSNKERPAEYFYQNLTMGTFLLHHAWKSGATKFVTAGAGCGYPQNAEIPLREETFWDGRPQIDSQAYSLSKRLISIQSWAYQQQHGFVSVIGIPGNLYGPWDNFNLYQGHVIPALVRKFVEATNNNVPCVEVWGTGEPTRDFSYVGDVALGLLAAADHYKQSEIVNISSGVETSVREVCEHLRTITGYPGDIRWDTTKPEGQKRRQFDISKAKRDFGFKPEVGIFEGLKRTVQWYRENSGNPSARI